MDFHPYAELVSYKQWADRSLYDTVRDTRERLDASDVGLLMRVLDHMLAVDLIFQHHLMGEPHAFHAAQSERVPPFDELAKLARDTNGWYVDHVGAMAQSDFAQPVEFTFTSGKPARMRRGEVLLHVCLHGQYHRGNVGALLQLRGITPPRDGFPEFLERESLSSRSRA
jgi:uncharacterized damage-inducible protein DinB